MDIRRAHEGEEFAGLDDAIDVIQDGLGAARLAILDGDSDALPAKAANVGVGELGVVTADHLLDVRHFAVAAAIKRARLIVRHFEGGGGQWLAGGTVLLWTKRGKGGSGWRKASVNAARRVDGEEEGGEGEVLMDWKERGGSKKSGKNNVGVGSRARIGSGRDPEQELTGAIGGAAFVAGR